MPRNPATGVFTRPSNSFSEPVYGTPIEPGDAEVLWDAYDVALSTGTSGDNIPLLSADNAWSGVQTFDVPPLGIVANPSQSIGLTQVDGLADTAMRSDAAPALDQSISPTWSGTHKFTNAPVPTTSDGAALGTTSLQWSDVFLASGAVVNYANGNFTITHSSGNLTMSGTLSIGTSNAFTCGTIELGAASDTTISRSAAGVIAVEGVPIYSNIPQNSQSTAYTLVAADAQKHIFHPSTDNNARTFTIPANGSVAYPVGTAVTFVNKINTVTIAINTDTLTLAGAGTTGSRSLAANGVATAIKIASTEWIISGTGLT